MNHFPASIDHLPDEELIRLQHELEECGVMSRDQYDFEPEDWGFQAHQRWSDILDELRWRHPVEPSGVSLPEIDKYIQKVITTRMAETIFQESELLYRLKSRR